MKKHTSLLLCVALVLSLCCVTVSAAGDAYLEATCAVDAENGTVELVLTARQTLTNTTFHLAFDSSYLTWVGAEVSGTVSAANATETGATIRLATTTAKAIQAGDTVAVVTLALTGGWDQTAVTVTVENWNDGIGVNELLDMTVTGTGYRFADVKAGQWFFEAVDQMAAGGYIKGVDATHFGPGLNMNRAAFVTLLGRLADVPETKAETGFVDVPVDSFYSGYVAWAYENGITTGVDETHFNPNGNVSRAQMVAFLYRYVKTVNPDLTVGDTGEILKDFADAADVLAYDWMAEPFAWAIENGVINGMDGKLNPYGLSNRAQVAVMLYRFFFD